MGRRKLEMKRIEDKSSRQVTFSKRRVGLIRKAGQLSVLCDIEVAVIIFSSRGKLYEFCSGNSLGQLLERHQKSCLEADPRVATGAEKVEDYHSQCASFRTSRELLRTVKRYVEETNVEQLPVTDLVQLEEELGAALMQTRSRKTYLMMEYITTLQEKQRILNEENEQMENQMGAAENTENTANRDDAVVELNNIATKQIDCSPEQVTLPLFIK